MNRYDVTDIASGRLVAGYIADAPLSHHDEWGRDAWTEQAPVLNQDGTPALDGSGNTIYTEVQHPATYTVTTTDITNTPEDPRWIQLRQTRNQLLSACDWTQMPDSPLSAAAKANWETYRQSLRSLPDQPGLDPTNPTWPTQPPQGA